MNLRNIKTWMNRILTSNIWTGSNYRKPVTFLIRHCILLCRYPFLWNENNTIKYQLSYLCSRKNIAKGFISKEKSKIIFNLWKTFFTCFEYITFIVYKIFFFVFEKIANNDFTTEKFKNNFVSLWKQLLVKFNYKDNIQFKGKIEFLLRYY